MIYLLIIGLFFYWALQYLLAKKVLYRKKTNWKVITFFSFFLLIATMHFLNKFHMLSDFKSLLTFPDLFHFSKGILIVELVAIVVSGLSLSMSDRSNHLDKKTKNRTKRFNRSSIGTRVSLLIVSLFTTLSLLFYFSCNWVMERFGNIKIDQIIYTISQPLEGTDESQITSYLFGPLTSALFFGMLITLIFLVAMRLFENFAQNKHLHLPLVMQALLLFVISAGVLSAGVFSGVSKIGYADVKAYFIDKSNIYEEDYVDPKTAKLTFPEKKRNLIYIFAESLESSYMSKDKGGSQKENLLPQLTNLLDQGDINFSNSDLYGGAVATPATGFTVGGLVAQTAGLPVKTSFENKAVRNQGDDANRFGNTVEQFLPGAYSLGDILQSEGYNQTFMLGSDISFAGRDKYFSQHGNYNIVDYNSAKEFNWIPQDYKVWWGYEDEKLLEHAKEVTTDLAAQNKPFNFTLLTADTHFEDGLMTDKTPKIFDDKYSNVIHYSDELITRFIQWAKEQPFYENTTIIVAGDHLTMDKDFFNSTPDSYVRTVFNLFDNSAIKTQNTKNRKFNTMDLFPTTLASLGVKIEGNRLGLGTNLFSDTPTLMEKLGIEQFNLEVSKRSSYYDDKIKVEKVGQENTQ